MIELIACDLDETLVCSDGTISKKNQSAIKTHPASFVVATGRAWYDLAPLYDELDQWNGYTISFNGAVLTENKTGKVLYQNLLGLERAKPLIQYGIEHGLCMQVYTDTECLGYAMFPEQRNYCSLRENVREIGLEEMLSLNAPSVKMLYASEDMGLLHHIEREIQPLTQDLSLTYSSNRYLEIMAPDTNKGTGLEKLADLLHLNPSQLLAIGDNINDLEMIECAGTGACVANALPKVKAACGYISQYTCEEDGVADILRYITKGEKI